MVICPQLFGHTPTPPFLARKAFFSASVAQTLSCALLAEEENAFGLCSVMHQLAPTQVAWVSRR